MSGDDVDGLAPEDAVHRTRTILLIAAASILEKCDEQILPALYAWVGAAFDATPTQLGNLALARAIVQALASPLGGISSALAPRGHVIAAGCLIWATFTALFGCLSSYAAAVPVLAMNGLGLALVIPNVQSLTADYFPPQRRGRAFGALWLTISLGGMLGALYATNLGARTLFGGAVPGWRFVFWSVAGVSAVVGLANGWGVHDPAARANRVAAEAASGDDGGGGGQSGNDRARPGAAAALRAAGSGIASVARIPTFALIILQGIVGSVPYASLIFLTLYFQLIGMSDARASLLVATYLAGGGVGGLLGGAVGDAAARRSPSHGRIWATQFSVGVGIPFAIVIFKLLPQHGGTAAFAAYAATMAAFALLTAWPGPCCNNPVFAEIVPPAQRNLVYAFDRCFEGAVAAFAAPLVGLLAERWYGFSGASTVTGDPARDLPNARALGSALLAFLCVPWALCLITYSGLHWTYPTDKKRALELQMQITELELAGVDHEAAPSQTLERQRLLADQGAGRNARDNGREARWGQSSSWKTRSPSPVKRNKPGGGGARSSQSPAGR